MDSKPTGTQYFFAFFVLDRFKPFLHHHRRTGVDASYQSIRAINKNIDVARFGNAAFLLNFRENSSTGAPFRPLMVGKARQCWCLVIASNGYRVFHRTSDLIHSRRRLPRRSMRHHIAINLAVGNAAPSFPTVQIPGKIPQRSAVHPGVAAHSGAS